MTEKSLDDRRIHTKSGEDRGGGVARVVQAGGWHAGLGEQPLPFSMVSTWIDWLPASASEDQFGESRPRLPRGASSTAGGSLTVAVFAKRVESGGRQHHNPVPARLRS